MKISKDLREFLTDKYEQELIAKDDWNQVFRDGMYRLSGLYELCKFLFDIDIDFLKYMNFIPSECFYNSHVSVLDLSSYTNLVYIDSYAFDQIISSKVILPESISFIHNSAFFDCYNLSEVKIGKQGRISDKAFNSCAIEKIIYPGTVEEFKENISIEDQVFYPYHMMVKVICSNGEEEIA